jgi:hypothetical protein
MKLPFASAHSRLEAPHSRRSRCQAMTLMEIMVASGIGSLLFVMVAALTMFSARSFVAMGNYADLDKTSRNALDIMSREIRQTKDMISFNNNQLTFVNMDGSLLVYYYNPSTRQLTRQTGNMPPQVLLTECDFLHFNVSQRNPSNNFMFYPAPTAGTAKLVDVSWRCSRKILGQPVNTESVQTAKIVIRN